MEKNVDDTKKIKEVIKEGEHKNDKTKVAVASVVAAGGVVGAGAAATTTATVVTGAALGPITIGGSVGGWLVSHGLLTATTIATTTVSVPVFLGIALPVIGVYAGYNIYKNHESNKLLEDFFTTVGIDILARKIADGMFLPVIWFLRSLNLNFEKMHDDLQNIMVKKYGYTEEFVRQYLAENLGLSSLDLLKRKIHDVDTVIQIPTADGKTKKTKEIELSFLHSKAIKLCKSSLNKECYDIDEEKREKAKNLLKEMKTEVFKKAKKSCPTSTVNTAE